MEIKRSFNKTVVSPFHVHLIRRPHHTSNINISNNKNLMIVIGHDRTDVRITC